MLVDGLKSGEPLGEAVRLYRVAVVETMVAIRRVKGHYIVRSTKVFRAACRVDTARFLLGPWNLHSSRICVYMCVEIFIYIYIFYYILLGYIRTHRYFPFSRSSSANAVPPPPSSFSQLSRQRTYFPALENSRWVYSGQLMPFAIALLSPALSASSEYTRSLVWKVGGPSRK